MIPLSHLVIYYDHTFESDVSECDSVMWLYR